MIELKNPEKLQLVASVLLSLCVVILVFAGDYTRNWLGFDEPPAVRLGWMVMIFIYLLSMAVLVGLCVRVSYGFRSITLQAIIFIVSLSLLVRSMRSAMSDIQENGSIDLGLMCFAVLTVAMINISGLLMVTYFSKSS